MRGFSKCARKTFSFEASCCGPHVEGDKVWGQEHPFEGLMDDPMALRENAQTVLFSSEGSRILPGSFPFCGRPLS